MPHTHSDELDKADSCSMLVVAVMLLFLSAVFLLLAIWAFATGDVGSYLFGAVMFAFAITFGLLGVGAIWRAEHVRRDHDGYDEPE